MTEASVKILLSANAVRALLADEPEVLIELTRNATKQVAEHLSRRWTSERVAEVVHRVESHVNNQLTGKWHPLPEEVKRNLVADMRLMIGTEVNTCVLSLVSAEIAKSIAKYVESRAALVSQEIERKVMEMVGRKVNERIDAMLQVAGKLSGEPR